MSKQSEEQSTKTSKHIWGGETETNERKENTHKRTTTGRDRKYNKREETNKTIKTNKKHIEAHTNKEQLTKTSKRK